jgi:hypothetical protein
VSQIHCFLQNEGIIMTMSVAEKPPNAVKTAGRDCIIGTWDCELRRHPSDSLQDKLVIVDAFEWDEANSNKPVLFELPSDVPATVVNAIIDAHKRSLFNEHAFFSVGKKPEQAIRAYGRHHSWGKVANLQRQESLPDHWYYTFTASGTSMKAAGIYVTGGVIMTWWK